MGYRKLGSALLLAGFAFVGLPQKDASAAPLLSLTVQPIQVCDNAGTTCANSALELFPAETQKIWDQAEILINFLPWQTVNDSARLNEDDFSDLAMSGVAGIVNMWFVQSLSECGGPANPLSLFGCGGSGGQGRVAITDLVFSFNGGIGRLDTIAHELGHVLGLGHDDFGAGNSAPDNIGANNVMTAGSDRTIPSTINDIWPDGLAVDMLTQAQIDEARGSGHLAQVPEPASILLLAMALLLLTTWQRIMRPWRAALRT